MTQIHVVWNKLGDINITVLVANSAYFDDDENRYQQVNGVAKDVEIHDFAFL